MHWAEKKTEQNATNWIEFFSKYFAFKIFDNAKI
jgi:hypothetical protein